VSLADEAGKVARADAFGQRRGRLWHVNRAPIRMPSAKNRPQLILQLDDPAGARTNAAGPLARLRPKGSTPDNRHNLMQVNGIVVGGQNELVVEREAAAVGVATRALPERRVVFGQGGKKRVIGRPGVLPLFQ